MAAYIFFLNAPHGQQALCNYKRDPQAPLQSYRRMLQYIRPFRIPSSFLLQACWNMSSSSKWDRGIVVASACSSRVFGVDFPHQFITIAFRFLAQADKAYLLGSNSDKAC